MSITPTFDTATSSIENEIKKAHSLVFRRAYIRRRAATSPYAWETNWVEITRDVKNWGTIGQDLDYERYSKLNFTGTNLVVDNESGRYNRNTNSDSLWNGFADYQQTLVKIECGYIHQWKGTDGIWRNDVYPSNPTVFIGIISGDVNLSDKSEVTLPLKTSIDYLRTFRAAPFAGVVYTPEQFLTAFRDVTASGSYAYRPLFGDTSTGLLIGSVTAADWSMMIPPVERGFTMWDFMEEAFETFNCFLQVNADGTWKLRKKDVTTTVAFKFFGRSRGATPDGQYGHTIKEISFYGPKLTSYYSPVVFNYCTLDVFDIAGLPPVTPFNDAVTANATTTVTDVYGSRPLTIDQSQRDVDSYADFTKIFPYYFPGVGTSGAATASAQAIVNDIQASVGTVPNVVEFRTSLITHLNLLDRVELTFDSTGVEAENGLWDLNNWDTQLIWDAGQTGSIVLTSQPFKILSIKINLDNLETTFVAQQLDS